MKPSEMIESIDRAFAWWKDVQPSRDGEIDIDAKREAVIQYLRNSIPKPVVEVGHWVGDLCVVTINGTVASEGHSKGMAEFHAKALRTALGINDTEGGE